MSLKRSPAGEKPERRDGKEGGQGSGGVLFRLGTGVEAGRPSTTFGSSTLRRLRGPTRTSRDPTSRLLRRRWWASRQARTLLLVPAAEVKKKEDQKKTETAEKAKKGSEPTEAAEAKKGSEPKETAENAEKGSEPTETAEKAKKGSEPTEAAEAKKGSEPKETAENAEEGIRAHGDRREGQEGSEPTEPKKKAAAVKSSVSLDLTEEPERASSSRGPLVKRQPKVKAMPQKGGKVKKVVLKSRAQRGIPERVDTALRMLSTKARERKKMGYLVKAINHAMRRKAEEQSGPPVGRTWAQHLKDHYAQIKDKEQPFVEVTVSEIIRGVPAQVEAQSPYRHRGDR